jgi:curved DNA-binding protein CbpA
MPSTDDPHAILGVPFGATQAEIRRRYKQLAMCHHPDRWTGKGCSAEELAHHKEAFQKITMAYHTLTNDDFTQASHQFTSPPNWDTVWSRMENIFQRHSVFERLTDFLKRTFEMNAMAAAKRAPSGFAPAGFAPAGFAPAGFAPAGFAPAAPPDKSKEPAVGQSQPSGFAPSAKDPSGQSQPAGFAPAGKSQPSGFAPSAPPDKSKDPSAPPDKYKMIESYHSFTIPVTLEDIAQRKKKKVRLLINGEAGESIPLYLTVICEKYPCYETMVFQESAPVNVWRHLTLTLKPGVHPDYTLDAFEEDLDATTKFNLYRGVSMTWMDFIIGKTVEWSHPSGESLTIVIPPFTGAPTESSSYVLWKQEKGMGLLGKGDLYVYFEWVFPNESSWETLTAEEKTQFKRILMKLTHLDALPERLPDDSRADFLKGI